MEWTLRKAEKKDEPEIRQLFIEMLRTIYQKEDVKGYGEGDLDKFFAGGGDWICAAQVENRIVAFLSIEEHCEPDMAYLYLDDFSVSAPYRGHGIGTELLRMAEKYAQSIGISTIVLHVEKTNVSARRLYERFGYRITADQGSRYRMAK